jgi:hypothetical protein
MVRMRLTKKLTVRARTKAMTRMTIILREVGMDECEPVAVPVMQDVGEGRVGLG